MTWRLLYVRPLAEKKTLTALGEVCGKVETYVAYERVWRGVGARRKAHQRLFLPSMVFANLPDDDELLNAVRRIEYVKSILSPPPSRSMKIEMFVRELSACEAKGSFDQAKPKRVRATFAVGDTAKVAVGVYAGFIGRVIGMNKSRRAKVIVNLFGRDQRLNIQEADLDPAPAAEAAPANAEGRQRFAA